MELELQKVSYQYKNQNFTLKGIDWQLPTGEIHCWLGRSGSGKSTLLELAAGLKNPTKGKVYHQGHIVTKPSNKIGFVFQEATLLNWKTVLENVLLPIQLQREITAEDINYAEVLLEILQISEFAERIPSTLSGGQKSRVAIARALIKKPTLLFLDEPFAALDIITREELQNELLRLNKREKIAMLFVTHDVTEAAFLADQIGVISQGEMSSQKKSPSWEETEINRRDSQTFREYCRTIRHLLGVEHE